MVFEIELKKLIKEKYGSVLAFSREIGLSYSTIDNIFKRGIMGVSIQIVLKVCSKLNIDVEKIQEDRLVLKGTSDAEIASNANETNIDKEFFNDYLSLSDQGKEYMLETMELAKIRYKKDILSSEENNIG